MRAFRAVGRLSSYLTCHTKIPPNNKSRKNSEWAQSMHHQLRHSPITRDLIWAPPGALWSQLRSGSSINADYLPPRDDASLTSHHRFTTVTLLKVNTNSLLSSRRGQYTHFSRVLTSLFFPSVLKYHCSWPNVFTDVHGWQSFSGWETFQASCTSYSKRHWGLSHQGGKASHRPAACSILSIVSSPVH